MLFRGIAMQDFVKQLIAGQIRTLAAGVGGYLVAHGLIDANQSSVVADLLAGTAMVVIASGWSALNKWSTKITNDSATSAASDETSNRVMISEPKLPTKKYPL